MLGTNLENYLSLTEVSSMLPLLRLVRTNNQEDSHNDVLTYAGNLF
jgi:hypothetical protein